MRNRVLFTHSYFLRFDPKQWKIGQPYAPLATIYAASVLREAGYAVALHDVQFAEGPESIGAALEVIDPGLVVLYDDGFNYLTKMCLTNMRAAAFRMIAIAKSRGCKVAVSSSDATDHLDAYLAAGADVVLIGEGEQTLLALAEKLFDGSELSEVAGIAYLHNGAVHRTAPRAVLRDLDTLPLPAWDLVDLPAYRNWWMKRHGYFSVNLGTTRGCPFKCNWCAKPIYGNRYHAHSPERVVEEIRLLRSLTDFSHIWFCDDIFGLKPGWVAQFAELMRQQQLTIQFKVQSRADLLVQEQYVAALASAGCADVWMGAESGSQAILDAMDKGITIGQIEAATYLLKEHGIRASFFLQFGYPGETAEDIDKTLALVRRLQPHAIGISVSYPLPGTVFYERVKSQLKEKANWTDSDELALMFRNTYAPAFYRQLHRFVHLDYRLQQARARSRSLLRRPRSADWPSLKNLAAAVYLLPVHFFTRQKLQRLAR